MIDVGSVVAGYMVESVLGTGGMGTVYLVQNPELPRREALKVLSAELSLNREFRARFIREADIAASLAHPNIVSIYDRGETEDGQLWIAMQYVKGIDAEAALRAGTMTPARAVHIIGEVALALDYAHHHQVVHRDIKPANFLLSSEKGGPERVLLADFGVARALDDVGLTATGSFVATMAYAAPEVLAGNGSDGRSDLYSLGCSLFRLLTGKAPFADVAANGPAAVMMAHLYQRPPRLADRVRGLPAALDSVITTALAKDPDRRFQSAPEFASAMVEALRDEPPSGAVLRPVPSADVVSLPKPVDGGWWRPPADVRTMPAPAGQPARMAPFGQPPKPQAGLPARRRRRWQLLGALGAVVLLAAGIALAFKLTGPTGRPLVSPQTTASTAATTTASATPTLPVSALPGLLLYAGETELFTSVTMEAAGTTSTMMDASSQVPEKECVGAYAPAQTTIYANSGYIAVVVRTLVGKDDPMKLNTVVEAVVAFPSADTAEVVVAEQADQWQRCADRTITVNPPGQAPVQLAFGKPALTAINAHVMTSQAGPQQHCERALQPAKNVVVDVKVCKAAPGGGAGQAADEIGARIKGS